MGFLFKVTIKTLKLFRFGSEDVECLSTPLGGIVLSYKFTRIPNIEEYFSLKLQAKQLLDLTPAQLPDGSTEAEHAAGRNDISAEVIGKDGKVLKAYRCTIWL